MSGGRLKPQLLFIGLVSCLLVGLCQADQMKSRGRRQIVREQPAPPPAPPVVLRPEQMPATPPEIAFIGGQLTISAENSTLGDILRAVRNQTGASVEVPSNATERVVGRFGPGPARDVLASLLNGSHFNYVLMGSATNPDGLERVILTLKPAGDHSAESASTAEANPPPAAPVAQAGDFGSLGDDQVDQNQDAADIFGGDEQNTQAEDQQGNNLFAQPSDVRTPEQMLQDLQRQQQGQAGQQPGQAPQPNQGPFAPGQPFRGLPNPRGGVQPQPAPQ
jgi:hypothetical protein